MYLLIGMEDTLPFDRLYTTTVSDMKNMNFNFSGYSRAMIVSERNNSVWKLKMNDGPEKYAVTNGTVPPFGTHQYLLSESLGGGRVSLNINACDDTREFNCKDGSCIPIEKR